MSQSRNRPAPDPAVVSRRGPLSKATRFAFLVVALNALLSLSGCGYNDIQAGDESVKAAWSEVSNQYQRRADLIPSLVKTVKGAANFEKETLEAVVQARAKATGIQATPELVNDPAALQKFMDAQGQLSGALSRLMVVVEKYPELRATEAFRDLQVQLEGTENRITVARGRYISVVQGYNTLVRSFPQVITAKVIGAEVKPTFEAREDVGDRPPEIDF